ncbi:mitochondrial import receptor subunit TOM20 homolog [Drosophila sulfurigaster albostrigata]|uniref:Mitochondrial import receptor subunit TOM20 homolog n=1 Tax=Drosophila albomicans TaxID=7291 RepID=A0A6P8WW71_DROAB|nr:mitochondrial import receptor subunit TOM20 homolog [Drosophila albomicans]XP_060655104.1 mitochondrial import receptor subunit TOM20 homolog [Drosophila nasuta]XP_062130507.1 mitochondrial import receptor subunit TOM20 homolog [Drosophila sulfurigaster albostrigata]
MIEINKTAIGIAAGLAGTLFIGYCIYFDKKRRNDPDYKKKVRERRRRNRKTGSAKQGMPNLNDHEAIERYFLQEIQLGETLIARGDFETGVEHLANAIVVCGQPARLLQVLQSSLPAQVFAMLIIKMQEFGNRAAESSDGGLAGSGSRSNQIDNSANILETSGHAVIDDLE